VSSPDEPARVLRICAACMYCDGLCPVFPELAGRREDFGEAWLSNLCHNCRACWHACQYAPPHPFAINAPAVLAQARRQTYSDHVWPRFLAPCFKTPALGGLVFVAASLFALIVLAFAASPGPARSFYAIAPWATMAGLGAAALTFAAISLVVSTVRFWRTIAADLDPTPLAPAMWRATKDILTLRHLDGGGPGCHDTSQGFSRRRKIWHHFMAGGVVLAFASTLVAAFYAHGLALDPPYPIASPPVLLGLAGGLGIVLGATNLLALEARMEREPSDPGETRLNVMFLIALNLVALSGLALLAFRDTAAMGPLLLGHISLVTGFFAALPASKAIHAPFRAAALLRAALTRRVKTRAPASD